MRVERMWIELPNAMGKPVMLNQDLTMKEIEEWRVSLMQMFDAYGFSGALVMFGFHNSPGAIEPVLPDHKKKTEPEPEPDPDPATLPQYRKLNSPFDLFKKM